MGIFMNSNINVKLNVNKSLESIWIFLSFPKAISTILNNNKVNIKIIQLSFGLHQAWVKIKNHILIWSLEKKPLIRLNYSSEGSIILCCGFFRPLKGVFVSSVEYVVVVSTI